MNKKRIFSGLLILLLAIPAYFHGGASGIILTLAAIFTGIKFISDGIEHYPQ